MQFIISLLMKVPRGAARLLLGAGLATALMDQFQLQFGATTFQLDKVAFGNGLKGAYQLTLGTYNPPAPTTEDEANAIDLANGLYICMPVILEDNGITGVPEDKLGEFYDEMGGGFLLRAALP
jgi:hypothetical protein